MSNEDFWDKLNKEDGKKEKNAYDELMITEEEDEEDQENPNINANKKEPEKRDKVVDKYMSASTKAKTSKDLVGIYFKPKHKAALAEIQERFGRGKKSEFVDDAVNLLLKDAFPDILEKMEKRYPDPEDK